MSKMSINKNNQIINNINLAINKYEVAISKITTENQNKRIDEIVTLIKGNIEELKRIKNRINDINSQINRELRRIQEQEKNKNEGESSAS